jgi:hypothetical protein
LLSPPSSNISLPISLSFFPTSMRLVEVGRSHSL